MAHVKAATVEASAAATRDLESAEQRLASQLKALGQSLAAQAQEAKVEIERAVQVAEEGHRTADTKTKELSVRIDRADEGMKRALDERLQQHALSQNEDNER